MNSFASVVKWTATFCIFAAASLLTINPIFGEHPLPFVLYLLGSCGWLIYGVKVRDSALVVLNLFFVVLNTYGVQIRL